MLRLLNILIGTAVLAFAPAQALALDILLTNDDGWDAPGIQTLKGALIAAGHAVTVVAPAENQSGSGGSLSTDVGGFVDVIQQPTGEWAVDSTPSDSVRAGLGAVLSAPPDLVISGLNFGQNLAKPGSNSSGTIGAALAAAFEGVPAIAASVGIDITEAGTGFPSTFAAFGPAADFVVRTLAQLEAGATHRGGSLLPYGVRLLNINFPVPYPQAGVKITRLGDEGDLKFVWQDVLGVIPTGGGPVLINIELPTGPDAVRKADSDAHREGFISITPMNADMTSGIFGLVKTKLLLGHLTP